MSDFVVRTLSSVALIAIALAATVLGAYYFALLVAGLATVMFYEWSRIVRGWGIGWQVAGFVYALVPALAILWLRERAEDGLAVVLWVFLVTWATDIGSYLVGRTFGRRKLAPSLSPKKTVEGLYGGIAAATLIAGAWVMAAGLPKTLLVMAPLLAVTAQAGDLFESGMKRRAGIKDSGDWLPGHGGFLDRLDGFVPVAVLTAAAQMAGLL